nr:uncharacterized protein LOC106684405 [Halyomorpha halys]
MFEAVRLPEGSTDAFYLTTNFPLCVETVESTTNYHISKVSQSPGQNGYVFMRTNIDYYFHLNEKQENVGTPFMNDSMTFSKDFVEVLLTKQFEENQITEENGLKQDKAIQTPSKRCIMDTSTSYGHPGNQIRTPFHLTLCLLTQEVEKNVRASVLIRKGTGKKRKIFSPIQTNQERHRLTRKLKVTQQALTRLVNNFLLRNVRVNSVVRPNVEECEKKKQSTNTPNITQFVLLLSNIIYNQF